MPHLNQTIRTTIINRLNDLHINQLIPAIPAGFDAWLGQFQVVDVNQLTKINLEEILRHLSQELGVNNVTALQINSAIQFPIALPEPNPVSADYTRLATDWMSRIILAPTRSLAERQQIREAIVTIPNLMNISPDQEVALSQALCSFVPTAEHQITNQELQKLLNLLRKPAQNIAIIAAAPITSINLAVATPNDIAARIQHPVLTYQERTVFRGTTIGNRDLATIPDTEMAALDKALCEVGPILANGRLSDAQQRLLTSTLPSLNHGGRLIAVPTVTHPFDKCSWVPGLWSVQSARIGLEHAGDVTTIENLITVRGLLRTRNERLTAALSYSTTILGAVVVLLEGLGKNEKAGSKAAENFSTAVLFIAAASAIIAAICKGLQIQATTHFDYTTKSLTALGIPLDDMDQPAIPRP